MIAPADGVCRQASLGPIETLRRMDHTYYRDRRIQPLLTQVITNLGVSTFTTALDNSRLLLLISLGYYSASVRPIHRSCDVAPTARRQLSPSATQCGFNRL